MTKKLFKLAILASLCVVAFSCKTETIPGKEVPGEQEDLWGEDLINFGGIASFTDASGLTRDMYLRDKGTFTLVADFAKAVKEETEITVSVDDSFTGATVLPEEDFYFSNDGVIVVEKGHVHSSKLVVYVDTYDKTLEAGKYVIPLKLTAPSGVEFAEGASTAVITLNLTARPDEANKGEGAVKNIFCVETNDTNPLNALDFVLENGKYFYDYVILFSGNINYKQDENRVYVSNNSGIQLLLDRREEFLVPLQNKGIKVLLGLLGNHDASGLAQLSDKGCKQFADDVKSVVETYDLDGVFYDDEYSNSPDLSNDLFASPSPARAARLMWEVKQRLPEKINGAFIWGDMTGTESVTVDGTTYQAKDFVDFLVANYGGTASPYGGMDKTWCTGLSIEVNLHGVGSATEQAGQGVVNGGYGYTFWFAPYVGGYHTKEWDGANAVSKGLYGQGLKAQEFWYEKNNPNPVAL